MLEEGLASSIVDALQQPLGLCLDIMDLRAYSRTKDAIEQAKKSEDLPPGMVGSYYWQMVSVTTATLMKEAAAKRLGKKAKA